MEFQKILFFSDLLLKKVSLGVFDFSKLSWVFVHFRNTAPCLEVFLAQLRLP